MAGLRSGSLGEPVPWVPCSQRVIPSPGESWTQTQQAIGDRPTGGPANPSLDCRAGPPSFRTSACALCTCPAHRPLPLVLSFPSWAPLQAFRRTQGPLGAACWGVT